MLTIVCAFAMVFLQCRRQSQQDELKDYINFTIDGKVPTSLGTHNADSLGTSVHPQQATGGLFSRVLGTRGESSRFIDFDFDHNGLTPGIYPVRSIHTYNLRSQSISINANITRFGAAAGESTEGIFSGSFVDLNGVTHTILGTFRLRRWN
jgi:hypothetical protein